MQLYRWLIHKQGSSVAHTFKHLKEWKVRGITRNPENPVAKQFAEEGIEIIKADLDDSQSLVSAFDGATAIWVNTDFFTYFFGYISDNDKTGRSPNQRAYDREVAQGLNAAEAAASPKVMQTLEYFIYSSLSEASKFSKGKYSTIYHNECKGATLAQIKSSWPELASKIRLVQVGHYVTNWRAFPGMAPQKQADGSYVWSRPLPPDFKVPFVVTHRDTGEFVKAVIDLPPGSELLGVSEELTFPQFADLWGQVNKVKARYEQISQDKFFEGVPLPLVKELGETYDYISEYSFTGGDPKIILPKQVSKNICFDQQLLTSFI